MHVRTLELKASKRPSCRAPLPRLGDVPQGHRGSDGCHDSALVTGHCNATKVKQGISAGRFVRALIDFGTSKLAST